MAVLSGLAKYYGRVVFTTYSNCFSVSLQNDRKKASFLIRNDDQNTIHFCLFLWLLLFLARLKLARSGFEPQPRQSSDETSGAFSGSVVLRSRIKVAFEYVVITTAVLLQFNRILTRFEDGLL